MTREDMMALASAELEFPGMARALDVADGYLHIHERGPLARLMRIARARVERSAVAALDAQTSDPFARMAADMRLAIDVALVEFVADPEGFG